MGKLVSSTLHEKVGRLGSKYVLADDDANNGHNDGGDDQKWGVRGIMGNLGGRRGRSGVAGRLVLRGLESHQLLLKPSLAINIS